MAPITREVLAEYLYEPAQSRRGYTNKTLYVNVGEGIISSKPVTEDMKQKFIGGRGFDLWLLWHAVKDTTQWDDPENEVVISSGPCGGVTQYPGAGKSIVVTLSPLTHVPIDSNVGGHFGPLMKFAGWDALELQGIAEEDVIVVIDGLRGTVTIEQMPEAPADTHELGKWLFQNLPESADERYSMSTITAGLGSDHTLMGCLNFSLYDRKRQDIRYKQAGRGGIGTVFRQKHIKAVVVLSPAVRSNSTGPADLGRIARVGAKMQKEVHDNDPVQNKMRSRGTPYLVHIMDAYDLLPTHNFRFGSHPDTPKIARDAWESRFTQNLPDGCWYGCTIACAHAVDNHEVKTGPYKGQKVIVDGPEYETVAGCGSNLGIFHPDAILEINFYCDTYGIDTISFGTATAFVMECFEAGILDLEKTGGLNLRFGNAAAAIKLLHQMAEGEGFGKIAGLGIRRMKKIFVEEYGADPAFLEDIGMENKGLEYSEYVSKESLAQQGGYALTNKGPQHDEAWLIFTDQVNNQIPTFEDKANALHYFPMWRTWFGLCGFCKLPWNDVVPSDNKFTEEPAKIPEHVDNYVNVFSAVTGREVTKEDLIAMSEGVYNFQRVFNWRMGYGSREHDRSPYRAMGPVTREEYESRQERYDKQLRETLGLNPEALSIEEKMAALRKHREAQYQLLIDAVYKRRGWTPNGLPTLEKLQSLGMDYPEVVEVVKQHMTE